MKEKTRDPDYDPNKTKKKRKNAGKIGQIGNLIRPVLFENSYGVMYEGNIKRKNIVKEIFLKKSQFITRNLQFPERQAVAETILHETVAHNQMLAIEYSFPTPDKVASAGYSSPIHYHTMKQYDEKGNRIYLGNYQLYQTIQSSINVNKVNASDVDSLRCFETFHHLHQLPEVYHEATVGQFVAACKLACLKNSSGNLLEDLIKEQIFIYTVFKNQVDTNLFNKSAVSVGVDNFTFSRWYLSTHTSLVEILRSYGMYYPPSVLAPPDVIRIPAGTLNYPIYID
ncbi:unnamed protein product [Caenorhabditis bovis]|uniref:Uncharacterized protein n=1 Tax=Caenorhabditis bovis TaxID=2654633 RepID=A0A8S1EM93_9PELO|nr:unnamed protein product [Caenorhabditis bovis]